MSASPLPTRAADSIVCASPPEHARLLVGSGVGWALDAMDVGLLISDVMTALAAQWGLSNSRLGWIGSIGFVGMMIGVSVGGLLADRLGRRTVFALILLIHGIATGAAALSVGVGMLIVLRLVVGIGLGAEPPVASTLVSEFAPPAHPRAHGGLAREPLGPRLDPGRPARPLPRAADPRRGARLAVGPAGRDRPRRVFAISFVIAASALLLPERRSLDMVE